MKVFITLALICLIVDRTIAQNQPSIKFSSTGLTEEEKVLLYEFMSESLNSPQGLRACITRPARLGTSCCKSYIARKVAEAVHQFDLPRGMTFCIEEVYETDSTTTTEQITSEATSEATSAATTAQSTVLSTSETTSDATSEATTAKSTVMSTSEATSQATTAGTPTTIPPGNVNDLFTSPEPLPVDFVPIRILDSPDEDILDFQPDGEISKAAFEKLITLVDEQIEKIPFLIENIKKSYSEIANSTLGRMRVTETTTSVEDDFENFRVAYPNQDISMNEEAEEIFLRILGNLEAPALN
ncbi:hypothetical protein ACOME3_003513 [Neoechinorhynchus agilis]